MSSSKLSSKSISTHTSRKKSLYNRSRQSLRNGIDKKSASSSLFSKRSNRSLNLDEKSAANTIVRTIKRHIIKQKSNFLTSICPDSGECMALGKETKTIRKYFDGFTNFNYVELPIKRIGNLSNSANGFIHKIKYTREGYS
jgi:hypothetical protein